MAFFRRDREVFHHYLRSINGRLTRTFKVDDVPASAPAPIFVAEFAPPSEEYDWAYATVGASRRPMPYQDSRQGEAHAELMIYSRQALRELVDPLVDLAVYPFRYSTYLGAGHTIAGTPGHGIVAGSPLTDILLVLPQEQEWEMVRHSDGSHTHVLWVIPLYPSERLFLRRRDLEALEERFAETGINVADLQRPPVV